MPSHPIASGPTDGVYDPRSFTNDHFFPLYDGVERLPIGDLQPLGRTAVRDRGCTHRLGWLLPWPARKQDVYVWKAYAKFSDGRETILKGDVTLLR
jgi:hypothetical protein